MNWREILKANRWQLIFICLAFVLAIAVGCLAVRRVLDVDTSRLVSLFLNDTENSIKTYIHEPQVAFNSIQAGVRSLLDRGASLDEVFEYLYTCNGLLVGRTRGVAGVYGIYGFFKGRFMDSISRSTPGRDFIIAERPWYAEAMKSRDIVWTNPYLDYKSRDMVISISQQVFGAKGEWYGVLSMDLGLAWLVDYTRALADEGGQGMLINHEGQIIVHPEEEFVSKAMNRLGGGYPAVWELLAGGDELYDLAAKDPSGRDIRVFFRQMFNGWYVGLTVPARAFSMDSYIAAAVLAFSGLLLAVVLGLIIVRLNSAKIRLEKESRAKTSFVANLSQEIRTPLNAILGLSEMLLRFESQIPPQALAYARNIKKTGGNLLTTVNDIQDFTRLDSGSISFGDEPYTLSSLVNDLTVQIRERLKEKSLAFTVFVDANLPNYLRGDALRIRQILNNILSNSVRSTERGSIGLEVSGQYQPGSQLVLTFTVNDTGIGYRSEELGWIYKEQVNLDQAVHLVEGFGLSLVIARKLVDLLGGRLTAESNYGHGSSFTVVIPQKVVKPEPLAVIDRVSEFSVLIYEIRAVYIKSLAASLENLGLSFRVASEEGHFLEMLDQGYSHIIMPALIYSALKTFMAEKNVTARIALTDRDIHRPGGRNFYYLQLPVYSLTLANFFNNTDFFDGQEPVALNFEVSFPQAQILVVDDLPTNLAVAEGLLKSYLGRVDLSPSGRQAVEMVQEKAYDLVFMDHMMPDMDGVETTSRIRSLAGEPFRKLPIIALTANAVSGMKEMFLANGFNDFLAKPIEKNKLEEVLLRWLPREKQTFTESPGAAQSAGPQSLPEIPGLDTVRGLAMTGGQKEGYIKILKIFVDDARQYLALLKEALDKGDWPKFTIEVHALKSSASTVGAVALSEAARKLEEAGRAADEPFVDLNFEIFHEDMLLLLTRLEHYLAGLSASARGQSFLSPAEIVGELKALRRAFDETDGGAIDSIITRLSEERLSEELRQDVDRLARHFLEVEYDEAIALIDILINGYQDDRP